MPISLPPEVAVLLDSLGAPPRLVAHLRLVHDVAAQLLTRIDEAFPGIAYHHAAVLFGAATHDIGKVRHPAELSGPGSEHEPAGRELLLEHGFPAELARFAGTHAAWTEPGIEVEDLLVSVADKIWKAKRVPDLEQLLIDRIATGQEPWRAFMTLDDILAALAAGADERLAFQARHPLR